MGGLDTERTHEVEKQVAELGLEDWISIQRRYKWRWAQKVATDTHGKWTAKVLTWDPTLDVRCTAKRRPGRPQTRWTDDIAEYIANVSHTPEPTAQNHARDNTNSNHSTSNDYDETDDEDDEGETTSNEGQHNSQQPQRYYHDLYGDRETRLQWMTIATDKRLWKELEENFVKKEF